LLDDRQLASRLAQEGRRSLDDRYNPHRVAARTGDLYKAVLARKRRL
jgi:hypothetical protein